MLWQWSETKEDLFDIFWCCPHGLFVNISHLPCIICFPRIIYSNFVFEGSYFYECPVSVINVETNVYDFGVVNIRLGENTNPSFDFSDKQITYEILYKFYICLMKEIIFLLLATTT